MSSTAQIPGRANRTARRTTASPASPLVAISDELFSIAGRKNSHQVPERINVRLGQDWANIWDVLGKSYPNKSDSDLVRDGLRVLASLSLNSVQGKPARVVLELGTDSDRQVITLQEFLRI